MWKDIVKVDDKSERWKRYRASQERGGQEKKPDQPKYKCAMCGIKLSRYEKKYKDNPINFCPTCEKARGK